MAWNEPGNDNKDPWGNQDKKRGNNDGPPDLDELLQKLFRGLFGGGKKPGGGNRGGSSGSANFVIGLILLGLVAFYFIKGVGIVNEQEKAVVLRFGKYHETKGPGFRWNPPLVDIVFTENVTKVRTWSATETMLTKDLNIVDIKLSAQYSISDAKEFKLNVKNPEMSLRQAASSALRHVVGSAEMHEVLTEGRSAIGIEVQARLQDYLNSYTTGIRIEKVNIEGANAPAQVQESFDDVIRAREDEERYKNEAQAYANEKIPQARGKAKRMIAESLAYKAEVMSKAEGEAKRFSLLREQYALAPEVTRQRLYIEALQSVLSESSKIMIDVEGGNNMMYLPLDKLMAAQETRISSGSNSRGSVNLDDLAEKIANKIQLESGVSIGSRRGNR